ncbi:hypothetical protein DXG01_000983 [Tephrocybe rancida]|nr:hypothetical protein DXG01_000983 [Tephrocybe rancida]
MKVLDRTLSRLEGSSSDLDGRTATSQNSDAPTEHQNTTPKCIANLKLAVKTSIKRATESSNTATAHRDNESPARKIPASGTLLGLYDDFDEALDYGMDEEETMAQEQNDVMTATSLSKTVDLVQEEEAAIIPEPLAGSSNTSIMPLSVSRMIDQRVVKDLGVIDLVSRRTPTWFLVVMGAPITEVSWDDFKEVLQMVIEDGSLTYSQFVQLARTVLGSEQFFWFKTPSTADALQVRGYLAARYTTDGVAMSCSFVSQAKYDTAICQATHLWPENGMDADDPPDPDTPVEAPYRHALLNRLQSPSFEPLSDHQTTMITTQIQKTTTNPTGSNKGIEDCVLAENTTEPGSKE